MTEENPSELDFEFLAQQISLRHDEMTQAIDMLLDS